MACQVTKIPFLQIMEAPNTEVRSSEIRELLNDTPTWFVRWGTVFILLTVVGIVGVSWFLKFPDIVTANVTISNSNPPVPVISPMKGILDDVFVKEGEKVVEKQILAAFSSPGTSYQNIVSLESKLSVFNAKDPESFSAFGDYIDDPKDENDRLELGSIRPSFNAFIGKLRAYTIESAGNRNVQGVYEIRKQIVELKADIEADKKKIPGLKRKVYFTEEIRKKEKKLYEEDKERSQDLFKKATIESRDAKDNLDDFLVEITRKEDRVIKLDKDAKDLAANKNTDIKQILNDINLKQENLDSEIKKWKQAHLLYAPIAGKISFYEKKGKKRKLFFDEGDEAMAILAKEKGGIVALMDLQKIHKGKVKTGDKVFIKLPSFPHQEYGKLKGKVTHIPQVPQKDFYKVEVNLSGDTLFTTTGRVIPFEQQLAGTAEIITDEKRLFQRIYEKVF